MAITDGLTHYWTLKEPNGTRADGVGSDDMSPFSSDADAVDGNLDKAADMTGDLVSLQTGSDIGLSLADTFSASVWWLQGQLAGGNRRILYLATGSARAFMVSVNSNSNRAFAQFVTASSGNVTVVPDAAFGPTIKDLRWNHFVCTFNRNDVANVYTNNRLAAQRTTPDDSLRAVASSETFTIGSNQLGQDRCNVTVQRVMIWDRVITPAEVDELFNYGTSIYNESPLLTTHRQTELARREVMELGFEGVVVNRGLTIDSFVWFDRRNSKEARGRPIFREQVGPMSGNWRALRAYLDPRGTILSETPA